MPTRAAIYTRISRDREGAGLGCDRQEQDCQELAQLQDWQVVASHRDNDISAYSGRPRPGYRALLDDIGAGRVDVVLCWHTDRLHRSPAELEQYISACEPGGVATYTVKAGPLDLTSPAGRMVARQLGAVARYEVEHAAERIARSKLQAARDGRYRGGVRPYGFESDGVTVRPDEAAVIVEASRDLLAGASLRGIAQRLNARGLTTSTGGPWRQDAIRRVLMRARNAGLIERKGEVVGAAQWPAIVDEDTWRAVVRVVTDPGRRTHISSARRWLLSGLAMCWRCGQPCCCTVTNTGRSSEGPYYMCKVRRCVGRKASELDGFVRDVVIERLSRPDVADLVAADAGPDTAALHTRMTALRERLDGLALAYADGAIDARQLAEGSTRLRDQLDAVEAEIAAATRGSALAPVVGAADIEATWDGLGLDQRRAIIDALMTITLLRAPKGRRPGWRKGESYFDPASVRIEWKAG